MSKSGEFLRRSLLETDRFHDMLTPAQRAELLKNQVAEAARIAKAEAEFEKLMGGKVEGWDPGPMD